jgi:hypothetical protein
LENPGFKVSCSFGCSFDSGVREGKISRSPCRFQLPILAGLSAQKFFKKPLASGRVFDIFSAPFRPKD